MAIEKPKGYEDIEEINGGDFGPKAGPCILGVVSTKKLTKNCSESIELQLDIAKGKYKNYYTKLSNKINKNCLLRTWLNFSEKGIPYAKGNIKACEESNNFVWDWDESSLVKKLFGANLREEEYKPGKFSMRIAYLCSVQSVENGEHKVLSPKLMDKNQGFDGAQDYSAGFDSNYEFNDPNQNDERISF